MKHRGADGSGEWKAQDAHLGVWRFWTTPEEIGEEQPLRVKGLPFVIAFDGRLDNREDLRRQIGNLQPRISDAALALHAYARWQENCFAQFVGEFALVIYDEKRRVLICARDPLGDRTLYHAQRGAEFVVTSEAWAAAGLNSSALNERAAAHYFALRVPADGQTFFHNVFELPPAHWLKISKTEQRAQPYWQPDLQKKIRYKTDAEYAEQFSELLKESVQCRMRSASPIGILMSGGLDSTSVACFAAQETSTPLTALSYIFPTLPECDERIYINAMQATHSLHSLQMPCDDAYPFKKNWTRNPNSPEGNPYRLLKERAYQHAREKGIRALLTGGFGDHLYDGAEEWLADLIKDKRYSQAVAQMKQAIKVFGIKNVLAARSLRRAARRAAERLLRKDLLRRAAPSPVWLTPLAKKYLTENAPQPLTAKANLLGALVSQNGTGDWFSANRFQVELRHPYRDRRLVEFMLAIPAYQLYYDGAYKHILRNAMQGNLPEIIRARTQPTSLLPFYQHGAQMEQEALREVIQKKNWQIFVRKEWLAPHWNIAPKKDNAEALIPWLCFSYETWLANEN